MSFVDWRIPARKKPLVSLRMYYRAGYKDYFTSLTNKLLRIGYSKEEIYNACVDNYMKQWVNEIVLQKM